MSLTHEIHELLQMIPTEPQIKELHACYGRMSGLEVPLTLGRMFQWEVFCKQGYNENDLRLVIEVLRRKIKVGPNTLACLKFSNLIGDIEKFQESLSEARAMSRLPKVDKSRESVLKATGRTTTKDTPPRTAEEVLRDSAAFKEFVKLKETL